MSDKKYVCPHCGQELSCWEPSSESGWDTEMYVCQNDVCAYFVEGRKKICRECEVNFGYRYCYNPVKDRNVPLAVWCGGDLSYKKGRCGC